MAGQRRTSDLITSYLHSISGDASRRQDVFKMATFLNNHLQNLGVETKLVDLGKHTMDGQELPLPPAILGKIGSDPSKKTVLVYGHFDVQPVSLCSITLRTIVNRDE